MRMCDENFVWQDLIHKTDGISCKHDILDFILTLLRRPSKEVNQPALVHYGLCLLGSDDIDTFADTPPPTVPSQEYGDDELNEIVPAHKGREESLHKRIIGAILAKDNAETTSLLRKNFETEIERAMTEAKRNPAFIQLHKKLDLLQEKLGLDHYEREIIRFALAIQALRRFDLNIDILENRYGRDLETFRSCLVEAFAGDDYLKALEIEAFFSSDKKLLQFSLLNPEGGLGKKLLTYLFGKGALDEITEDYFELTTPSEAHQLEQFSKLQEQTEILIKLIKGHTGDTPLNILLHGRVGTGKNTYVHALARHLGHPLYKIAATKPFEYEYHYRRTGNKHSSLELAEKTINSPDAIFLIEGCQLIKSYEDDDALLIYLGHNTDTKKTAPDDVFHSGKSIRFWINNHPARVARTYLQRFDYAIEFKSFSKSDRAEMLKRVFEQYQMDPSLNQEAIDVLCQYKEISETGMNVLIRNYLRINDTPEKSGGRFNLEAARPLINTHLGLVETSAPRMAGQDKRPFHRPDYLSVKGTFQLPDCQGVVENFLKRKREEKLAKGSSSAPQNLNILLHGPPGTGKTEFVRYLCDQLNLDLIIKTGSSILGMYIGQTEKNIANAFKEASAPDTILFMDEIDALLHQRNNAVRSWEVSQISELLIQMERFQGILICASNFIDHIDHAAIRRFHVKMEFDYLSGHQKVALFKYYFTPMLDKELTGAEEQSIANIPCLTPGDFGAIHRRISLHQTMPTVSQIIETLVAESSYKTENQKKIGFR